MPRLMAACDVMVENAGGLTANEAFAVGLPVVTYLPIAGHGKDNAEGMEELGVTRYARAPEDLRAALDALATPGPEREAQIERAHALFVADPADDVLVEAARRAERNIERPVRMPKAPQRLRVAAVGLLAMYGLLTLGAQGVSAFGVGVAAPPPTQQGRVYLGVRLTADEIARPRIRATLDRMHATAILDAETVRATDPEAMQALADRKVDVGNGGWGEGRPFRYLRAETDVVQSTRVITAAARVDVKEFVPGRRFDAFDQLFARRRGQRLVRPDHTFRPDGPPGEARGPRRVSPRRPWEQRRRRGARAGRSRVRRSARRSRRDASLGAAMSVRPGVVVGTGVGDRRRGRACGPCRSVAGRTLVGRAPRGTTARRRG